MKNPSATAEKLLQLLEVVERLRSPSGCLWDRAQSPEDIARYLLEEAYEVAEAIENGSPDALQEELGDLLFQIVFLAHMAEEEENFNLADVLTGIREKMIRRHPHVFGDKSLESVAAIKENWEAVKKTEGKGLGTCRERLDGVAIALPTLARAQKLGHVAAKSGFDWSTTAAVVTKVEEELDELKAAIKTGRRERAAEEMGDLLFSLANLCRFLGIDAEASLRGALHKFTHRVGNVEDEMLKTGKKPTEATAAEIDRLWNEIKLKRPGCK